MITLRTKKLAFVALAALVLPTLAYGASRMDLGAMESFVSMDDNGAGLEPQNRRSENQTAYSSNADEHEHQSFERLEPQTRVQQYAQNSDDHYSHQKGQRAHARYQQNKYRVQDWRNRSLSTPPRGYHWVRNENDEYMLIGNRYGQVYSVVHQNDYQQGTTWYRGDKLSRNYRGESHYVNNYRTHHLHSPARGQRWVRVNNQYLLIGIATGLVVEAVLSGN